MIKGLGLYFKANALLSDSLPHIPNTNIDKPQKCNNKECRSERKKEKKEERIKLIRSRNMCNTSIVCI